LQAGLNPLACKPFAYREIKTEFSRAAIASRRSLAMGPYSSRWDSPKYVTGIGHKPKGMPRNFVFGGPQSRLPSALN